MGLTILKNPAGEPRPTWYAVFYANGKRITRNLDVPILGTIPRADDGHFAINAKGDPNFERSREAAKKAMKATREAAKADPSLLKKRVLLSALPAKWRELIRDNPPSEDRQKQNDRIFDRFASFVADYGMRQRARFASVDDITPELASAYVGDLRTTYAWQTVRSHVSLLSSAWRRFSTSGEVNPFKQRILKFNHKRDGGTVHHRALTEAELLRLYDLARDDAFLYPLIVCAACTGMRLGDVCNLLWEGVDTVRGVITCVTGKTGTEVTIPIIEPLDAVLAQRLAEREEGEALVFPAAAAKYRKNRDGITKQIKPLLARVVFGDDDPVEVPAEQETVERTPAEVEAMIAASGMNPAKVERLLDSYRRHIAGESYRQIEKVTGRNRGLITVDLAEVEKIAGVRIRRGCSTGRVTKQQLMAKTRQKRKVGQFSACLYGWHSLRCTFVVLALENGVPEADIQLIVGHSTFKTTKDNYYVPTKKHTLERMARQKKAATTAPAITMLTDARVEDILDGLTREQKEALILKLARGLK